MRILCFFYNATGKLYGSRNHFFTAQDVLDALGSTRGELYRLMMTGGKCEVRLGEEYVGTYNCPVVLCTVLHRTIEAECARPTSRYTYMVKA